MFSKSFQSKLTEANKVFTATIEKLKTVKAEIAEQMNSNNVGIEQLQQENSELESLASNATRQIEQIGKLLTNKVYQGTLLQSLY